MYLTYKEPECVELALPELGVRNVSVKILREDLNHDEASGNKWWKLKHNLLQAAAQHRTILTFGGAFSNHLYATAAAAAHLNIPSIGVVRGGPFSTPAPTLEFASKKGMLLHHISRDQYKQKDAPEVIDQFYKQFGDLYIIPEGGSNEAAVRGCEEWGQKILSSYEFDVLCLPVGTGGTIAGLARAFGNQKEIVGFSALKDGSVLVERVKNLAGAHNNWQIESGFHFGGYAKVKSSLIKFMQDVYVDQKIPLDAVYTSKALWGLVALIEMGRFKEGQKILFIHTGGLQGNLGFFNSRFPEELKNRHAKA